MYKKIQRTLKDTWCNLVGEVLFFFGRQAGYSTGICGMTTCGYGKLSFYGYWQYPVCSKEDAMKREEAVELAKVGAEYKHTIATKGALD